MKEPYGFALIINNKKFEGRTEGGIPERRGSQKDVENLEDLWKKLGFVVEKHQNLKVHQIFAVVEDMVKKLNQSKSSCFVCCIMTHGAMDKIYASDCQFVNISDIMNWFKEQKCPALAGKPKLFFVQTCRGRDMLSGRGPLHADALPASVDSNDSSFRQSADPDEANFLLGYSTAAGKNLINIIRYLQYHGSNLP